MSAISGTATWRTVVTVVAASSGDGDTIAAKFNGLPILSVSDTNATATNASGTVTIYWPQTTIRAADRLVQSIVTDVIRADTSLTAPISITVATTAVLAA
jgi:hypothetical protein